MHKYTDEQIEFITANTTGKSYSKLAEQFNKEFETDLTGVQIKRACWQRGISNCMNSNRRKRPIGAEIINRGFVWVKVKQPSTWRKKHHVVWEQNGGLLRPGGQIVFLDNDPKNCDIRNLEVVDTTTKAMMAAHRLNTSSGNRHISRCSISLARLLVKLWSRINKHNFS